MLIFYFICIIEVKTVKYYYPDRLLKLAVKVLFKVCPTREPFTLEM